MDNTKEKNPENIERNEEAKSVPNEFQEENTKVTAEGAAIESEKTSQDEDEIVLKIPQLFKMQNVTRPVVSEMPKRKREVRTEVKAEKKSDEIAALLEEAQDNGETEKEKAKKEKITKKKGRGEAAKEEKTVKKEKQKKASGAGQSKLEKMFHQQDPLVKLLLIVVGAEIILLMFFTLLTQAVNENAGSAGAKKESKKATVQTEKMTEETESESETETETEIVTEKQTEAPKTLAEKLGVPQPPQVDLTSWEYVLVNSEHPVDENFAPEIGTASCSTSTVEQDERIVAALNKFAADAEAQGLPVYLSSGYRSYWDQSYLYDLQCQYYTPEEAAKIVAIPGTSEHQTGLCCDITDVYREFKNDELEDTDTYKWMYEHCAEYGFILRFPKDKEDVTQIIYEPWHFRYVGETAAKYIMENHLTLEEFWELCEEAGNQSAVSVNTGLESAADQGQENQMNPMTQTDMQEGSAGTVPETESETGADITDGTAEQV